MQAVLLAGGLGTRLRPITYSRPKPLVPLLNRPMILHLLDSLPREVDEVLVAANYMIEALENFLKALPQDRKLSVIDEEEPLGTGGALKNLEDYLSGHFLVYNADIISSLDTASLISAHRSKRPLGTIALHEVEDPSAFGMVELREDSKIERFVEKPRVEEATSKLVNAGVYVLDEDILELIPPGVQVSLEREVFPRAIPRGLQGFPFEGYWVDAGTLVTYLQANRDLLQERGTSIDETASLGPDVGVLDPVLIGRGTTVRGGILGPFTTLGAGCVLTRARVAGSVLLNGVTVEDGALVEGSILGEGCVVGADARVVDSIVGDDITIERGSKVQGQRVGK